MAEGNKLGAAQIPIEADLNPLDKGLDGAKKKLQGGLMGLAKTLGPIVGGIFGVALIGKAASAANKFLGDSAKMAAAEEAGITKLRSSIEATGASWGEAQTKLDAYLESELQRTALDDGDGREALSRLTAATGDYNKAMDLMAITQDLARAKGMDLANASEIVGRVAQGNVAMLTRYGITLEKGATAEEALAELQKRFSGQAEAYAKTAEGSAKRREITLGNLRENIGAKLLPVIAKGEELFNNFLASPIVQKGIDTLVTGIGNIADKVVGVVNAFQLGAEEGGGGAIFLNVASEILGQPLPDTWIDTVYAIEDAIKTGFATAGEVIEGLKTKWEELQPTIDRVAAFIQDNATPILSGLGAVVAAVVIPAFVAWAIAAGTAAVGTIAAALPVIAIIAAIGAGVALLVAAWTNDWGGIATTLTAVWTGTIQPALATLMAWLQVNIPLAIATLSDFWTNTLLPAIQAVSDFVQSPLTPMLETLGTLLGVTLTLAVTALAGLWQNVLLPAITAVANWFTANVIPALTSAWSWLAEKLGPAVEKVTGFFDKASGSLGGLGSVIEKVTGFFSNLAAKVAAFKLPAVLTPGSPTPFEEGLVGIGDAVVQLTAAWGPLASSLGDARVNTIKNLGKAFREMGKGVTELVNAFKGLQALALGGGGSIAGFDIGPMLEDLDRITGQAMTKIQDITNRFGKSQIEKLKSTSSRLKTIVENVLIDMSAIKERKLPDMDVWFWQLYDVFGRAASMVVAIRARFSDNLLKTMAEAAGSIGQVFTILTTKLEAEAPKANFLDVLTLFLTGLEAGAALLIPWLERIRNTYGQGLIDQAGALSQALGGIFDVLNVGKLFAELTTEEKLPEGAKKLALATVLDKLLSDLAMAADKIMPALQVVQDKWGTVLEAVQATAQLLRDVFGGVADAYQSAVDFATGDTLDLGALSAKLAKLSLATGIVMASMTAPTWGAAPGLAGAAAGGGAAMAPTAITVNIYGADGALQGSYTQETNDARVVDIKLGEALGAA